MGKRSRSRRNLIALGVSLGVHLGLLCLAVELRPHEREQTPTRTVELKKLAWIDAAPAPVGSHLTSPPGSPRPTKRRGSGEAKKTPTTAPNSAPPPVVAGTDAPRDIEFAPSSLGVPVPGVLGGGRTLHPGDLPSEEELLAGEHERVAARVDGWLHGGLASARVRGGLPDPSYGQLGAELRAATDEVPKFIDTDSPKEIVGALLQSWGAGAERYGKTGAPYAEPEGRLENVERPSSLSEGAARGSPDAIATANFLAAGARLQEFADGRAGLELFALVEVRQQAGGALESVTLIKPSGLVPFDGWVTQRARAVALGFSFDGGARAKPLRSVWRFDGIILYRRKVKPGELDGRAVLGMITMSALSALSSVGNVAAGDPPRPLGPRMPGLSGRFDERTGELDLVDLTNPTYDCRVTLIEAD